MSYQANYAMYSKAPDGWHDEPFEYVFNFQNSFTPALSNPQLADFLNAPMQFDPDADFYFRELAILIDLPPSAYVATGRIDFNMRLRNAYGRALDNDYIPMQAYATSPQAIFGASNAGPFSSPIGAPVASPIYPEMFFPANGTMWGDFQAQGPIAMSAYKFYSFHIYLAGIKRFQNEAGSCTV